MKSRLVIALLVLVVSTALVAAVVDAQKSPADRRASAAKTLKQGNFKDAYQDYRRLVLDKNVEADQVGGDLQQAVVCLTRLNRIPEIDALREQAIALHAKNWRLLKAAAQSYLSGVHYGYMISGKFERGQHRGGGQVVNATERDRVRGLQLMTQATALAQQDDKKAEVSEFFMSFSRMLLNNRGYHEAWRLQTLSDLSKLPDYDPGWGYGRSSAGAPADAEGNAVFHHVPKTYEAAKTDGERWRWTLAQTVENNPGRNNEVRTHFAQFLQQQFGVQTMAYYGRIFRRQDFSNGADDDSKQNESGVYALHTLGENETIAKLATGIKRFELPDEFNFVKIFRQIAGDGKSVWGERALASLATTFENRRQYPKAADLWRGSIKQYGDHPVHKTKKARLDQIVGNWGRFDSVMTQPSEKGATVDFRYRNATAVEFKAHEIKIDKLLADVKAYIKSKPARLDWNALNIQNLGHRLVTQNQSKYIGSQVAKWNLPLKPRKNHFDRRITVTTPLQKAGAYLLTSKVAGGNINKIVIWISGTAIAKKQLAGKTMYYVADANSGTPIKKANVELFGYRQVHVGKGKYRIDTLNFAEFTDANGQVRLGPKRLPAGYQWIVTARTKAGRHAFLGYDHIWHGSYRRNLYNRLKVFTITDRPVYRPQHDVQFKAWVHRARYDQDSDAETAKSEFANHKVTVEIYNPKGEKIYTKGHTTDEYGGFADKLSLPTDATLGVYRIQSKVFQRGKHVLNGSLSFRVEEYKKPEFEVTIDAPDEPVKLGDKITAKIKANYLFGAPVTEATVKYKILRTSHNSRWYPRGDWDWFYGSGYWWYASDYSWYPGWHRWGCKAPVPIWWQGRNYERPEIIAEREVKIGHDGIVTVEIDTAAAQAIHPDQDHQYQIIAEVVDRSRRTIVGNGTVLVARRPFKVFTWVDRGYYRTGDPINASFSAHTLDQKPVQGKGTLQLLRITYDKNQKPVETEAGSWAVDTDAQGRASHKMTAAKPGQYRLSYKLTDSKEQTIEGGYLFTVTGAGFDGGDFRFSHLELIPQKREYRPGETLKLMINTNRAGSTVLLFVRPVGGIYLPPRMLHIKGKSTVVDIKIEQKDMPNFFVEAITISGAKLHSQTREILVPPEKRVLDVAITPSSKTYLPGEQATVQVKLTDASGEPFVGSTVVSIYDKAVEYISGGSNVPEIKSFFWKWRRHHYPRTMSNLGRYSRAFYLPKKPRMNDLGAFGATVADKLNLWQQDGGELDDAEAAPASEAAGEGKSRDRKMLGKQMAGGESFGRRSANKKSKSESRGEGPPLIQPTVRSKFADTAFWAASITTNKLGIAQIALKMPENLTTWKIKAWAMGHGTKVGQGEAEVITKKNLIVRMQTPRFFVEKDEVVLSANVHNYLKKAKQVRVTLTLDGDELLPITDLVQSVTIPAGGESRVDWRVQVSREGLATVRMSGLTDEESDAVEMKLPVYVHGMLKTESWTGSIRPEDSTAGFTLNVPEERRIGQSRLEIRYSPTLAGAMVDALPYLVEYPYGCTEQTLNRFVPTVITQKILLEMKIDLAAVQKKRTNLNAQEIGDDQQRAKGWKRFERNPVFDKAEVDRMVKAGVDRLTQMQLSDGGWGWFSGWGEHSSPHTTAVVVHGLQTAQANDVALVPGILKRGVRWLQNYQNTQVTRLKNAATKTKPYKLSADNLDALVYMVLVDADIKSNEMRDFLYRDRTRLAVYSMAMVGIAYEKQGEKQKLAMIMRNISQYVVHDEENETAYLNLPENNYWWHWYGSENEAHAYYLKLLAKTDPKGKTAPRLVKYILNNRKHATYWKSTRDTALCVEALADYLRASGEQKPDMTVEVWVGGKRVKTERITAENLFTFDNRLVLTGEAVRSGKTKIEIKKTGSGPVYFNAYLTNFTLEDHITHAGLEVKVRRKYYKLTRVEASEKVAGSRGQAVDQKIEKYERTLLENLATLKSGDLVEIELEIESKNDYEYLIFEDMKAAGFEPVSVRSGYGGGRGLGAYMELRDNRVSLFVQRLARGKHSIAYRMRAEIPGKFSALPTRAYAMYAPELKANSDEIKLKIVD